VTRTGRPRGFDEQRALARAQDVFWTRGYEATSVQDLVDALAVQRGSLYAAFGDKRSLYLKAVSLYARENRARLETALETGPVLPTLRRMLAQPDILTSASASPEPRGCLVGNTTAQLVPGDEAAKILVAAAFEGFIDVVAAALRRGQAAGEVSAAVAPEVQAQLLLLLFQGSALVSRAGIDHDRLIASIDLALGALMTGQDSAA
jgi:TetR/AcrR family transcriptional regulator, transcriptional repressor for nem operon